VPVLRRSGIVLAVGVVLIVASAAVSPRVTLAQINDPNHETTTADIPGLTAASSLCGISEDETFGVTEANPVKVGGGAVYLASREVKYLSALRGPAGQGLHFKRNGSLRGPDGTILDSYTVEYAGIPRAAKFYIDGYHWTTPIAPKGWLCGAAMNLDPPGPDPFETQDHLRLLAVQMGEQPVAPISIDPDGSSAHGVVFDHVRAIALAARAAAAAGKPLDPKLLPREVGQPHMIAIAYPLSCDGKSIAPESLRVTDGSGNSPQTLARANGDKIADLAPGFTAPPGSIGISYAASGLIDGAKAIIKYSEACAGSPQELVLAARSERGRLLKSAPGIAPAGVAVPAAGAQVRVQVFLASDGTPLFPAYAGGPYELAEAAIAAAKEWRVDPPKMNGAPLLQTSTLSIVFRER
jgi:hypothetical protein